MTDARRDPRVASVVSLFEQLAPSDVARLGQVYCADASFKDPFNDVRGVPAIEAVFTHMFASLDAPRFKVLTAALDGDQCFLTWDFHFRFKRFSPDDQTVHGATLLHFGADGRVAAHRDYWDAAEELYEKLPAVGALMRWLKRRARS